MCMYIIMCYYNCEFLCTYVAVTIDIDNNAWHKFYRLVNITSACGRMISSLVTHL